MKIDDFGSLQMIRTNENHFGTGKIEKIKQNVQNVQNVSLESTKKTKSFEDYLFEAVNTVNSHQNNVTSLQEKLITDPDSVDVHDVTIAMSKARSSLNLAQTVIDRLITSWNEISTTR